MDCPLLDHHSVPVVGYKTVRSCGHALVNHREGDEVAPLTKSCEKNCAFAARDVKGAEVATLFSSRTTGVGPRNTVPQGERITFRHHAETRVDRL